MKNLTDIDNNMKEQFRSKFNDFESKLSPDGWERIEVALNHASINRFVARRRWYIGTAAAILAIVVGGALFLWDDTESFEATDLISATTQEIQPEEPLPQQDLNAIVSQVEDKVENELTFFTQAQPIVQTQVSTISVEDVYATNYPLVIERIDEENRPTETNQPRHNNNQLSEEFILIAGTNDRIPNILPQRRRRDNVAVSLVGRGGITSFHMSANSPMTLRALSPQDDAMTLHNLSRAVEHNAEKEHAQPISFGATVSIPLVPNLFIETGLVYTLLSSRVINANPDFIGQQTQHLHYLGIPLIVNYRVFQFNRLNLYASAGGMVETDIFGESRTVNRASGAYERSFYRISQENPQFSVNAGVGASFPLFNRFRLQGRVGGAYYFDARNKYRTIYSDRKIVLDLNLGIRYEF